MSMLEIIFWCLIALILYTLAGYPILLSALTPFTRRDRFERHGSQPTVSFIVAAYNEERNIAAKLKNLRAVVYPSDKTEYIIGSDASTDDTDRILADEARSDRRLTTFRLPERKGKVAVLNEAVTRSKGELLIFTDCSVRTDADIMDKIIPALEHPKVGLVSSRDVWVDAADGTPREQKQYIGYEMNIRKRESRLNSLVSASGSFFAVRRSLFRSYGSGQADDFSLPLQVYRQGHRVVHIDDLIGYVPMVKSSGAELSRRTRIVQAGIKTVLANWTLLNPLRYPVFAWQLWSHKVLKWCLPFMVIVAAGLAVILFPRSPIYRIICIMGLIGSIMAIIGAKISGDSLAVKTFRMAYFFVLSMLAVVTAWGRIIHGTGGTTWEPSHR